MVGLVSRSETYKVARPATPHNGAMDDAVRGYIDATAPERRPCSTASTGSCWEAHPDAEVVLSYKMPTYKVGRHRLYVGVWKHGVSICGLQQGRDAGFITRHPSSRRARGRSSCGPTMPPASVTTSSAIWCAPPSTADHGSSDRWSDSNQGVGRTPVVPVDVVTGGDHGEPVEQGLG